MNININIKINHFNIDDININLREFLGNVPSSQGLAHVGRSDFNFLVTIWFTGFTSFTWPTYPVDRIYQSVGCAATWSKKQKCLPIYLFQRGKNCVENQKCLPIYRFGRVKKYTKTQKCLPIYQFEE